MVEIFEQDFEENKRKFERLKNELIKILGSEIAINHVGSTAIPDMIGKDILDILIGAKNQQQFEEIYKKLCSLGYIPSQNSKTEIYQFFASNTGETHKGDIHIHLVICDTERYNEFLILRNYLLENKEEAKAYAKEKQKIVGLITTQRKEYRSIKSQYVTELIKRAKTFYNNK